MEIIKIDTEGSEALILQGAKNTIKKNNSKIIFEFCEEYEKATPGLNVGDSQQVLKALDYDLYNFNTYPKGNKLNEIIKKGSFDFVAIKLFKR